MKNILWTWTWTVAAAALLAAGARAGEVKTGEVTANASSPGLFEGPVTVGFFDVDFATGRRATPRTELGLGLVGAATIDTPDFYGAISGGAVLYGSYALSSQPMEIFGQLQVLKVQYVQNASLKGLGYGLGQGSVGATYALVRTDTLTVSPSMRLMLPTDTGMPDVRTVGLEAGGAASWRVSRIFEVHGYLGGDISAGLSSGSALARPGLLVTAGLQLSPTPWFAVVVDANGHVAEAAYLAPAVGLRAAIGRSVGIELGATLPLLGTIRSNGAFGLRVAYRM
jgi:hypothetical protein